MAYVEWNGDWSRRQPAVIDEAEIFVFPLAVADAGKLDALCDKCINGPSNRVQAKPWIPLPGADPMVLLAAARFSKIHSGDSSEFKGYIDELDIGLFVPVEVTVGGQKRGLHALNPYLYVDNPVGVIIGREIFGFPKIEGAIGWWPSALEFDLRTLVFTTNDAGTGATRETLISLKRSPVLSFFSGLFGFAASVPLGSAEAEAKAIQAVTEALAVSLLEMVGAAGASSLGFTQVKLPLLKQYRSATVGTDVAYQDVVRATFEIESISAFTVYPRFLFWLSPLTLRLYGYESVDIAKTLGLASETKIKRGFRVLCKLRLEGTLF